MGLKCGIVGITNTGKTTLFNCMSKTKADATSFAFSTSQSNIGVAEVRDPRLDTINSMIDADKVVPATIDLVDIPGLAKGSSQGEGVGNKFLADIQQTDALIHVLRCFDDINLPHVDGSVDPLRDIEVLDLELQVRDLDLVERKIQRLEKLVKTGDKKAKQGIEVLNKYVEHLGSFQNARTIDLSDDDKNWVKDIQLLTEKPVLYVCNVDDAAATTGNKYSEQVIDSLKDQSAVVLIIAGKLEAEIAELDIEEERVEFLEDAGLKEPGVNKLTRGAYDLLNLQSFITAGKIEVRAWTIRKGTAAPQAAGVIHSDLERGFIRAEVMSYDDFIEYGSEHAVKDAGKFRVEGKNYIVKDGDMLNIRFNV